MARFHLGFAGILLLSSCATTPTAPAVPSVPAHDYFAKRIEKLCHLDATCGTPRFSTEKACAKAAQLEMDGGHDSTKLLARVKAGTVVYHGDKAAVCIAALTCGNFLTETAPAACTGVTVGTLATGKACSAGAECASENCDGSAECPGTCGAAPKPIAVGAECEAGGECDGLCVAGKCTAYGSGKNGQACRDGTCAPDMYCEHDELVNEGVCAARAIVGQACKDGTCAENLFCKGLGPAKTGVCASAGSKVGDACDTGEAQANQCTYGLYCLPGPSSGATQGNCMARIQPGAECKSTGLSPCLYEDMGCHGPQGNVTCRPRPAKGEACTLPEDDASGSFEYDCGGGELVCDPVAKACSYGPAAGQPCDHFTCAPEAYCKSKATASDKDMCVAKLTAGQDCDGFATCAEGLNCDTFGTQKCVAKACKP